MSAWSRREKLPLGGLRRLWSLADSANIFASRIVGRNEWRNSTAFIRPTQFIEYFNAKGGSSVDHPRFNKSGISSIYLPIPFPSKDSKFILLSFFFLRANLIDRLRKRDISSGHLSIYLFPFHRRIRNLSFFLFFSSREFNRLPSKTKLLATSELVMTSNVSD